MTLIFGLLFGAVGTVYFIYGKRIQDPLYLIIGFALVIYPYFFSNAVVVVLIGAVLALIPYAHHKGWF